METKNKFSAGVLRLLASFVLLASLLFLPKAQGAVGDTFTIGQLKYTVLTENQGYKTGTVTVRAESTGISGDIVIPASVTNRGINYWVPSVGGGAFSNCSSLTSIVIPDSVTSMGEYAFAGCSSLTNIVIPDSVTEIAKSTFAHCTSLTNIIIPDSVTSIDNGAFYGCTSLTSIIIPDSVTYIYSQAFQGCTSLTSATIGNKVFAIVINVFYGCSSLTNVTIGNGVTSIGGSAFYGCSSLTSIIIPNNVSKIYGNAFGECSNLTGVYFEGNAPALPDGNAFFAPAVIYYKPGATGWTNPWDGRPTALWIDSPEITEQPQSQAVIEGDPVTFSVVAEGTEPLSYQWYKEGVAIENATGTKYTIESVSAGDLGNYTVVVSNIQEDVTSDVAVLSYILPPTITAPLVSLTVDAGTQASFQVEAQGADSYQWYKNDIPITGATGALYTIESAKGIDVGTYKVVVTNRAGTATSTATLALTQSYRATGTVQVVNGYVVGLTVTDGGWGYTQEPGLKIRDETGKEATGHCVIENGIVTQIILDNPGSDYSGETTVLIGSPLSNTSLEIAVSEVKVKMHLILAKEYQLWSSADCIEWTPVGEPFIAEEEEMDFWFKVEDYGRFFKLQEI